MTRAKRMALIGIMVLSLAGVAWMFLGRAASPGLVGNANVLGGLAGAAALITTGLLAGSVSRARRPAVTAGHARATLDRLALEVLSFWEGEAKARRITTPVPAVVRWMWANGAIAARADEVRSAALTAGVVTTLRTDLYEQLESPARLVIVGAPGAGKTTAMMLLLIDVLRHRVAGSSTPGPVGCASC